MYNISDCVCVDDKAKVKQIYGRKKQQNFVKKILLTEIMRVFFYGNKLYHISCCDFKRTHLEIS